MPRCRICCTLIAPPAKPNSNFHGVQIGVITYSYRSLPGSAEDLLKYLTTCGISSVELMGGPAEGFAKNKRFSEPMEGFKALRKMYNDAGVNIHIVKFGNIGDRRMSDDQIEYYFQVAKALRDHSKVPGYIVVYGAVWCVCKQFLQ